MNVPGITLNPTAQGGNLLLQNSTIQPMSLLGDKPIKVHTNPVYDDNDGI